MDRRQFLMTSLAAPFAFGGRAFAEGPLPIGDMHTHLFFFGPRPASSQPLGPSMAAGGATLVSWSLVGDVPWIRFAAGGRLKQKGTPKGSEAVTWFREELGRITQHIAEQKLKVVRTAEDIDRALAGEPHVVLSVEGATFLDDGVAELDHAYAQGIRQLQLVHYVRNALGDFQTARPEHGGLTDLGRTVIGDCNRRGILVDLSHCTGAGVADALRVSKVPVVWSHGSVTRGTEAHWSAVLWKARQLTLDHARAIADAGGVIGLWSIGSDVGRTPEAYAGRLLQLADWLGEDHVAFGTDMNAVSTPAVGNFADLRRVVRILAHRGVPDARIRKLAIGNYARVLKAAFAAREA